MEQAKSANHSTGWDAVCMGSANAGEVCSANEKL